MDNDLGLSNSPARSLLPQDLVDTRTAEPEETPDIEDSNAGSSQPTDRRVSDVPIPFGHRDGHGTVLVMSRRTIRSPVATVRTLEKMSVICRSHSNRRSLVSGSV